MKRIKVGLKFKRKIIIIENVKKLSEFQKGIGLMFKKRENCPAMLFEFDKPTNMGIHSLFVSFKFAAVWLDDKNRIVDKKIIKPFRLLILSKKPFYKLLEIPLNNEYDKKVKTLFGKN